MGYCPPYPHHVHPRSPPCLVLLIYALYVAHTCRHTGFNCHPKSCFIFHTSLAVRDPCCSKIRVDCIELPGCFGVVVAYPERLGPSHSSRSHRAPVEVVSLSAICTDCNQVLSFQFVQSFLISKIALYAVSREEVSILGLVIIEHQR